MRAQARPLRPKGTECTNVCPIYKMYQIRKMAQSERGGLDFGRAKPADPSARARARARARYLKKHAARFAMRESLEQKFANLLLRCAQWTNLCGGIFPFLGDRVTHTGPLVGWGGGGDGVGRCYLV